MSFKYKLIFIFILIIISSSLPLTMFSLNRREKEKIADVVSEQKVLSEVIVRTSINILLMNGGDIKSSVVDSKEMISILTPQLEREMVHAETILLSSDKKINGLILASLCSKKLLYNKSIKRNRLTKSEVNRLLSLNGGYNEYTIQGDDGEYLEFVSIGRLPGGKPVAIGRIVVSKTIVLGPIQKVKKVVYAATGIAIIIVSIIGYLFSLLISQPIRKLTSGMKKIESGEFHTEININSNDEFGVLSRIFNEMIRIINVKIYELEATNKKLSQIDKIKDRFLANTSHELRTPIHGIIGIADSLIDGAAGTLNEKAVNNLSMIVTSGKRLNSMINDILDYSRMKYSAIEIKTGPVDISQIVDSVINITRPLVGGKKINIRHTIKPEIPYVQGDEDRVRQIIINLIGNAIKFTKQGEITVSALLLPNDNVEIIVKDTGIGIPLDMQKVIFNSFEQADGSSSREYSGSGLGLTIVKKLVELQGGEISVVSEPGAGSIFRFTLPVWDDIKNPDNFPDYGDFISKKR